MCLVEVVLWRLLLLVLWLVVVVVPLVDRRLSYPGAEPVTILSAAPV